MGGSLAIIAWGLWCLLWAPGIAARYQNALRNRSEYPDLHVVSPREWRIMGGVWVSVGLAGLLLA